MGIKYVHTNIIARDWEAVARFYIEVFECSFVALKEICLEYGLSK